MVTSQYPVLQKHFCYCSFIYVSLSETNFPSLGSICVSPGLRGIPSTQRRIARLGIEPGVSNLAVMNATLGWTIAAVLRPCHKRLLTHRYFSLWIFIIDQLIVDVAKWNFSLLHTELIWVTLLMEYIWHDGWFYFLNFTVEQWCWTGT